MPVFSHNSLKINNNWMKTLKIYILLFLLLSMVFPLSAQQNTDDQQLLCEQEATKQTEKMQQELHLTPQQTKQIYDINLRYARERQISNTRSQAMERMKNKDAEIQQVLSESQYNQLQNKRYERTAVQSFYVNRNPSFSSGFRSASPVRSSSVDVNTRTNYRSTTSVNQSRTLPTQTTRQSIPSASSVSPTNNNTASRSSGGRSSVPKRTEILVNTNRR